MSPPKWVTKENLMKDRLQSLGSVQAANMVQGVIHRLATGGSHYNP